MSKAIKVYGTTAILAYEFREAAHKLGLPKHRNQVRLICGATSMAEANRLCEVAGMYPRMFQSKYASTTGNQKELELAGKGGIFIRIDKEGFWGGEYYSLEQLKKVEDRG